MVPCDTLEKENITLFDIMSEYDVTRHIYILVYMRIRSMFINVYVALSKERDILYSYEPLLAVILNTRLNAAESIGLVSVLFLRCEYSY